MMLFVICLCGYFGHAVAQRSPKKPHILLVLADDLGFANVGWNRKEFGIETKEIQTPVMDQLVAEGVQLTRFYAYHMCSPTRSALQTGRFSLHVNMANTNPTVYNASSASGTGAGIPRNMTAIASKMKEAGYRTHMAGKWDAGMATPTHCPHGRGYDTSLSYFHHSNGLWDEMTSDNYCPGSQDLWDTTGPAHGIASSPARKVDHRNITAYEEYKFEQRLVQTIMSHDPSTPLFLFYSSRLVHVTYEVPDQYLDKIYLTGAVDNSTSQGEGRLKYAAMVNFLDGSIGNVTDALKAKGMWENTLMLFLSDNGGPIYLSGNNYPLRGGKYSEFEGGVRVAAFASGGLLPATVRGTRHSGIGSYADVYTTLCSFAGVDPKDASAEKAGLPPVDGLDLSDMLLTGKASPRLEMPLKPLGQSDINSWNEYVNRTGKIPKCWRILKCDFLDADLKVVKGKSVNECCDLCDSTNGCAAAVWAMSSSKSKTGTCHIKKSARKQIISPQKNTCFLPGTGPGPAPILGSQAGIIIGDMKLITGVVSQSWWTGPTYPNASTPEGKLNRDFTCSLPGKLGCLFNVSADPSEHHDLIDSRPEDAKRLFDRLLAYSKSQFDPPRGAGDPRACKQVKEYGGFFGPWLELDGRELASGAGAGELVV